LIALEIDFCVREQRLVLRKLPVHLLELYFERPWIDFGQQLTRLDDLPFVEQDADQLSIDARADRDGAARADGSEGIQVDVEIALPRGHRGDRRRPCGIASGTAPH